MSWLDRFRRRPSLERKSFKLYDLLPRNMSWTARWSQYSNAQAIDAYRKSVWLYSCVDIRANNIASVPWVVEVNRGREWEQTDDHELAELLERPNPDQDFQSMIKRAIYWLDLTGDAWFTKVRDGAGRTREWWSCLPDIMEVVPGRDRLVAAWKYRQGMKATTMPADDIIHLMYSGPGSIYYGLSPLQAAAQSVDVDQEAANFQKVTLQNFGMPPGFFSGPEDLTPEQYEQQKKFIDEHSGPEHNRKPWILAGFTWQAMAETPHELDFLNSRAVTRIEICSAYSVPPPMIGIYEGVGGLNSEIIRTARRIFWLEGLIPILRELEGQLNRQLAFEFGPGVRLTYDLSNVEALEDDQGSKVDRAMKLWGMGIPLAEINRLLELGLDTDNITGADIGYLPSGLLPTDFDAGEPDQMSDAANRATYTGGVDNG